MAKKSAGDQLSKDSENQGQGGKVQGPAGLTSASVSESSLAAEGEDRWGEEEEGGGQGSREEANVVRRGLDGD